MAFGPTEAERKAWEELKPKRGRGAPTITIDPESAAYKEWLAKQAPPEELEYASDLQIDILRRALEEGTLFEKGITRPLHLTPGQIAELGFELPEDYIARLEPKLEGAEPFISLIGPEGVSERFPLPTEIPEVELPEIAEEDVEGLLERIRVEGRTPEIEDLMMEFGATAEEIESFFAELITPEIPKAKPEDIQRILRMGGVSEDEIGKVQELATLDLDSEGWLKKFLEINPSTKKSFAYALFSRSFAAGLGDIIAAGGGVAGWVKQEDMRLNLLELAGTLQSSAPPQEVWKPSMATVLDPRFWQTMVARALPFSLSFIPLAVIAAYGGAAVAGAVGLGAWGSYILTVIFGGVGAAVSEATLEAGGTYNEAKARGFTDEQASEAASSVFQKNILSLTGMNAAQFFVAFLPAPARTLNNLIVRGLVRTATVAGRMTVVGLSEAGEEVIQDIWQRQALGEEIEWDDEMKMVAMLGAIMGVGLGGAGEAFTSIQRRTVDALPEDLKSQYDADITAFELEGLTPEQAQLRALDAIAETKEGKATIDEIIDQIQREETIRLIEPETEAEVLAWEHISKQEEVIPEVAPPVEEVPLIEALIKEGEEIVAKAEAIEPNNASVIEFRRLVNQVKEATTPEAKRQALIQMEALEDEVRAIAKVPKVVPKVKPEVVKAPPVKPPTAEEVWVEIEREAATDEKGVITPPPAEVLSTQVEANTPMMHDITVKERVRGTRHVFDRMGIYEIWEGVTEAEVLVSEANEAFTKEVDAIAKRVGKDKERWGLIFDEVNERGSVVGLAFEEKRAVNYIRKWADEWANKKNLPEGKRIKDYIPHLFEQEMIDQIKEQDGISPEIASVLSERVATKITDPFLKERLGALGFMRDPFRAIKAYNAVSNRVLYYEPFLQKIAAIANDTSQPLEVRDYLKDYSRRMTGEPTKLDQSINKMLGELGEKIRPLPGGKGLADFLTSGNPSGMAAYNLTGALYPLWMGWKLTTAIRNLSQHGLIIGEVGPSHFAKGIGLRFTKEGRAALKKSIILRGRKMAFTPGIDASFADNWSTKFRENAMWMFRFADKQNVSDAFLAGYSEAKSLLPDADSSIWIKRGDEVAADTQYIYTKMNSMAIAQTAPGRVFSVLTTWTENWIELAGKWVTRRPSRVYLQYKEQTGIDVAGENWSSTYKAVLMYMVIATLGYVLKEKTRLKALEYTGITSLRYLAGVVAGEFPGLEMGGSIANIVSGFLTRDDRTLKMGWNKMKNVFTPGVIRQMMGVALGDKDWLTLFFYLEGKDINIKRLKNKWEKGWKPYEDLSDVLIRADKYPTLSASQARSKWREENPLLEAQMFVVGQFTTLSSEKARIEVLRLIEKHKLNPDFIDGYEKVFGIDTSTELAPYQNRIGNLEKLKIGEEAEYFDMGRFAEEVHKLVNSQGRSKVARDGHALAVELLNAEDLWEPYFNQESADQRKLDRQRNPELEAQLYLWGKVQSFENPKSAEILLGLMKKYDIPPQAINAFQQDPSKYDELFTQKFELEQKWFDQSTEYENYGNTESDLYIEDKEERQLAREKFKEANPNWVADMRRIEAIDKDAPPKIIESWVDRGKTIDKFGAGSSEAMVWLLDNPEAHKWALEQELLTDDGSDWNEAVLRLNVEMAGLDEESEQYALLKRRKEAYTEGFPEDQIDNYAEYYQLPVAGYRQERFLIEHPDFAESMHNIKGLEIPKPQDVPPVRYDELSEQETRTPQEDLALDAYKKLVPEKHIESYVGYYSIIAEGKPEGVELWYEDDWWMIEHSGFYKEVYLGILGNERKDYRLVPTREVYAKYEEYLKLPPGKRRDDYRFTNQDLDAWLVLKFDYVPITEKRLREEMTPAERQREEAWRRQQEIEEKLAEIEEKLKR